jgi:hypothetical protein
MGGTSSIAVAEGDSKASQARTPEATQASEKAHRSKKRHHHPANATPRHALLSPRQSASLPNLHPAEQHVERTRFLSIPDAHMTDQRGACMWVISDSCKISRCEHVCVVACTHWPTNTFWLVTDELPRAHRYHPDLGYVGDGPPETDAEAKIFARRAHNPEQVNARGSQCCEDDGEVPSFKLSLTRHRV